MLCRSTTGSKTLCQVPDFGPGTVLLHSGEERTMSRWMRTARGNAGPSWRPPVFGDPALYVEDL